MNQNEANGNARDVIVRLFLGNAFVNGVVGANVKTQIPGALLVAAQAADVSYIAGSSGSYRVRLGGPLDARNEVSTVGTVYLEITKPGTIDPCCVPVPIDPIPGAGDSRAAAILDTTIEGPLQYDGLGEASIDPAMNISVAEALRAILAYASGNATGLDGPNVIIKSRVGGRNRIAAQIQNGNRTITSRDES